MPSRSREPGTGNRGCEGHERSGSPHDPRGRQRRPHGRRVAVLADAARDPDPRHRFPFRETGTQPADTQPIPAPLPPAQFGIAIGPPIASTQAKATWDDLSLKLGSALLGLNPLMNGGTVAGDGHLVAGPIADVKDATALCKRLEAVAVACLPVPYIGARITN